ncbi:MAG: shikimate dehydrogenase [Pseudomonadota bacterium]
MAETLQLAVFGHPVTHSQSPAIHARFAESVGLKINYQALDCPAGRLAAALQTFRANGGHGCNLTVPLKTEGLALASHISPAAELAGACNTLVWSADGWQADNTDGAGLMADLKRQQVGLQQRRILILGAGGAVAGILPALIEQRPSALVLVNRSVEKAQELAQRYSTLFSIRVLGTGKNSIDEPFDLMIQGTSLGHQGRRPEIDPAWLKPESIVYDLNYGQAHEPLRGWCEQHALRSIDGSGMLVEQAAMAFELFTGHRPETDAVVEWIRAGLTSK